MRKQQHIWQQQYENADAIPILTTTTVREDMTTFWEQYGKALPPPVRAIDIGSGMGRNALYLAKQGVQVDCVDYVPRAIEAVKERAQEAGLQERINAHVMALDSAWHFADATFDIAIDIYSTINIETLAARTICRDEIVRTLKPGGYFFIVSPHRDDALETELRQSNPGPEPNSSLWPPTDKFQKHYDEDELRDFYGMLNAVSLDVVQRTAKKLGRTYEAMNIWGVFQKP